MKYNDNNQPLQCMLTNNPCYKANKKMDIKGVLWHSTGANNPYVKRFVQPLSTDSNYQSIIAIIGKNAYNNDWNHTDREVGVNAFIGKNAGGNVITVQTMPWNMRPWGCGSGSNGSCNSGWIQFEICEDDLKSTSYFNAIYKEACELTAYLCKKYNINPKGTQKINGITVPNILCHADSHKLGLGSGHADVLHWFKIYGKTMNDVRNDVEKLLNATPAYNTTEVKQQVWDFLLEKIKNPIGIAGLMGNMQAESSFIPNNLQDKQEKLMGYTDDTYTNAVDTGTYPNFSSDRAGYGLVQFTHPTLKSEFLNYVKLKKTSISDIDTQLSYLCMLLPQSYKNVWKILTTTQDLQEASNVVLLQFEKPNNTDETVQKKRYDYAKKIYSEFMKTTTTTPPTVETQAPIVVDDIVVSSSNSNKSVRICHSAWDENEKGKGGVAGDQTGAEVCTRSWYSRPWDAVLRYPNTATAQKIAEAAVKLASSNLVGYDQAERNTLYNQLSKNNWNLDAYLKSGIKTETDCASFIYACCCIYIPSMRSSSNAPVTSNMLTKYKKWGFTAYTDKSYTTESNKLLLGDILLKADAHTAIISTTPNTVPTVKNTEYKGKGIGTATALAVMNIRNMASTNATSYGTIPTGTVVEVLEVLDNGWYKIVYTNCADGYAYTSNTTGSYYKYNKIKEEKSKEDVSTFVVKVTGIPLNIRKGPGTNYPIAGQIKTVSSYTIIEKQNNFGKLKSGAGWICLDYTERKS